jgi:hypothetical protein
MWPRNGDLAAEWKYHAEALAFANNLALCGYDDWRLPNINELESIMHADQADSTTWLATKGFMNVQSLWHWTSTTLAYVDSDWAWSVLLSNGATNRNTAKVKERLCVWPVRTGEAAPPAALWRTGQYNSWVEGDDGALRKGVPWPDPRFRDEGDGTVTDLLTGLAWSKDADTPGPDVCEPVVRKCWIEVQDYIRCLNEKAYLGYTDWRLPNRTELVSLVDRGRRNPALPENHPFTNIGWDHYWSSTSYRSDTANAWTVNMYYGEVVWNHKSYSGCSHHVWPVRGGQVQTFATLTVATAGSGTGTVTSSPGGINCGEDCSEAFAEGTVVTLTATPGYGSVLTGWSGGGCSGTGTCQVTINGATQVTATFIRQVGLTVNKSGGGSGTVTSSPPGIACGSACFAVYEKGTSVTLNAAADAGAAFEGWSGACSGTGTCSLTLNSNTTVNATFTAIPVCTYTLKPTSKAFTANGGNVTVSVTAAGQTICPSPAITAPGWISTTPSAWVKNKGTIRIAAPKTTTSQQRSGTVYIGGQAFAVTQAGAACAITKFTPASQSHSKWGQSGFFGVEVAPQDCAWTTSVSAAAMPWLHITSGAGTGNGTVQYGIDENSGKAARSGTISVVLTQNGKKKAFTVRQGNK